MDKNFIQRSLSGIVYVALLVLCVHPIGADLLYRFFSINIAQAYLYFGLITLLTLGCLWEVFNILKFGKSYERWLVFPLGAFVFYLFAKRYFGYDFYFNFRVSEMLALSLIGIAAVTVFKFVQELYYDNGKLIFAVIYAVLPFGFALGLPQVSFMEGGFSKEVFYLFILIWSSDTFAYIAGRLFGKHKMAPKISPKKTWEGFAGGVLLTLVLSFFIQSYSEEMRGNWIVVGVLVAVFAPLGDLVESQLKRSFGVKDSGNIIPGHGGILDRLDSFIICVPVVYLYFVLDRWI